MNLEVGEEVLTAFAVVERGRITMQIPGFVPPSIPCKDPTEKI